MRKAQLNRLIIFLLTGIFIGIGTFLMIRYAQGYRPTKQGTIKGTGLLAANSFPTGAEVYINDRLTTATDATLNLDPGEYLVEVKKDGYFPWSKRLVIEEELVTQTNATLFPSSPALQPLTYTGAINPVPSPDGNKIAFAVASASATAKNGLYVQDLPSSAIALNKSARQITRNNADFDYTTATYTWSPNGSQILVSFENDRHVILDADRFNDLATLIDVTVRLPQIFSEWEEEITRTESTKLAKLPDFMVNVATSSATNLYLSPDGEKILYQAQADFVIPASLIPPLPSTSTQQETREVMASNWYVYDLKEDKNFLIADSKTQASSLNKINLVDEIGAITPAELGTSPSAFKKLSLDHTPTESISLFNAQYAPIALTNIQWFPDSYHLILVSDRGLDIIEYDQQNRTTIYAGPFDPAFVYPWPDGSKIITRIQFSPDTAENLYTIKLK